MWLLWCFLFLHLVIYSEAKFGTPYVTNLQLCRQWNCLNTRLGLPPSLPPREQYDTVLKSSLPGEWHQAAEKAFDVCYGNRTRTYSNTCAGQALMHCAIDNLIDNCPEEHWRKDDGCSSVSSSVGVNYMFFQSRYQNFQKSIPKEHRPAWLQKYFSLKCCNVPNLFNSSLLIECGFGSFLKYHEHNSSSRTSQQNLMITQKFNLDTSETTEESNNKDDFDPLSCCDVNAFINPLWRSECDFRISWNGEKRLKIEEDIALTTTVPPERTTVATSLKRDVKVVPLSCDKETCIFKKLNVISESGVLDLEAYSKFLDNFTSAHLSWTKAKARVITQCLAKNSQGYEADCEINRMLSCTFDVLTENCPNKVKGDVCSSRPSRRNHTICQISSSKYRPKHRRSICGLPSMVDIQIVTQCGASGINTMEFVRESPVKYEGTSKKYRYGWHSTYSCQDSSPSTLCLMSKMGVLNKYSFMDHFKMTNSIRAFTRSHTEWSLLSPIYINTINTAPLYCQHCSSPKKLLNIIDTMLTTCPISKRKNTARCNDFFRDIYSTSPTDYRNMTENQLVKLLEDLDMIYRRSNSSDKLSVRPKKYYGTYTEKKPIHDYGLLSSSRKKVPPVRTIDVKNPPKAPLVILPVYLRKATTSSPLEESQQISITQTPLLQIEMETQKSTERLVTP